MRDVQPIGTGVYIRVIEAATPAIRWEGYVTNSLERHEVSFLKEGLRLPRG
jgi:hypothetical protein